MNYTDLLISLLNNSLSDDAVREALITVESFRSKVKLLEEAGFTVTVTPPIFDPIFVKVYKQLDIPKDMIQAFKNNNPAVFVADHRDHSAWPRSAYFQNKIPLIKLFREKFNVGLRDAKWSVEMLYEGQSDTSMP